MGIPIDRVIHAEVWATDTIPADLPPMVEFKAKADKIILERYGLKVEHFSATRHGELNTYQKQFYCKYTKGNWKGKIYGFPMIRGAWCNSELKMSALNKAQHELRGGSRY